ncbi:MAG TPA: class I SAM-dependent methyltransferase [Caulobacteraceae bacterium]|jgi:SAM-dependent methyltransferase
MSEWDQRIDHNVDASQVLWRAAGAALGADNDPISSGASNNWIPVPSVELREASSVADMGIWYAIGEAWSQIALAASTQPNPRILDIGCGVGKMARFFAMTPGIEYLGIDVFAPAIQWCQKAFDPLPQFRFVHFDIHSPLYNASGVLDVATTPVPTDETFDLIICASLFTHLYEAAFVHYLAELSRLLSRDGRAIVSIHNEPDNGRLSGQETRIDISDAYFVELIASAKLRIERRVGPVFGQELYVLGLA